MLSSQRVLFAILQYLIFKMKSVISGSWTIYILFVFHYCVFEELVFSCSLY